jgi:hypothetical protein
MYDTSLEPWNLANFFAEAKLLKKVMYFCHTTSGPGVQTLNYQLFGIGFV